jgi:hypothetical protein
VFPLSPTYVEVVYEEDTASLASVVSTARFMLKGDRERRRRTVHFGRKERIARLLVRFNIVKIVFATKMLSRVSVRDDLTDAEMQKASGQSHRTVH